MDSSSSFSLSSFKTLFAALAVFYFVTKCIRSFHRSYQNRKFAKAHGCQLPPQMPSPFWGIPNYIRLAGAAKEGKHVDFMAARFPLYGNTWRGTVIGNNVVGTIEPENLKAMLATSFKDFSLGKFRHDNLYPVFGDGIFTLDGPAWEHSRALLRPQFARNQISDLESLEVHVQRLLAAFPVIDGGVVELQQWFFRLTLDSSTEFLFGESVDSLLTPDNTTAGMSEGSINWKQGFAEAFNTAQDYLAYRARFQNFFWLVNTKKFRDATATIHRFADHFVNLALKAPTKSKDPSPGTKRKYIFLDALAEETQNPKILRDQLLNILLAGRDTSASLSGWTFYLLARHPRVYQKLREEILLAFGTGVEGSRKITFESLKDVTYLRYVLNEVLRLYPSVPTNSRTATCNTTLPVGGGPDGLSPVFIYKGQHIEYSVYALHRRTDIYGPDAAEFRPERWGEGKGRVWEYLPFNGGPRICLGQQFALTEVSYTVVRIMQNFSRIENADPVREVQMDATLIMAPSRVLVKMYKA